MRARTKRFIPLFWQAVFILLPVTVLAVVSLIALRRDAQRAELDARNRATEDVQSLALAMRSSVNDELGRFLALQYDWTAAEEFPGETTNFPRYKLESVVEKWNQDYPTLKMADVAAPRGEILTDGRQIVPRELAPVPIPPEWFRVFSPRQRVLWTQLKYAIDANGSEPIKLPKTLPYPNYQEWLRELKHANTTNLFGEFLDTDPPFDAAYAATLMQTSQKKPAIDSGERTDMGLTFGEMACYRLLSANDAKLTESLVEAIWWQVTDHPSFISARLLQLDEALTNHADAALSQQVYWTRRYWNKQSLARAWLLSLPQLPVLTNWNAGKRWTAWANDSDPSALAFFQPCTCGDIPVFGPAAASVSRPLTGLVRPGQLNSWDVPVPGSVSTEPGYEVSFVPQEVIDAIFSRALQQNKVFIPDYEAAAVTVEGEPNQAFYPLPHGRGSVEGKPNQALDWQLLGSASQTAGPIDMPNTVAFSVNLYLTSREQMLSAERRRFRLFVMLISGAAISALVGLIATWRAFYRQQELNEMKINFVSSVSHELRAPIASVRLMAENLERGKIPDAPRQNEYFRFIVQECRRLSSLIENVLDFSRIEQGRKQYEFEPANLVALVQITVKLMEPYAAEKGVRLEITDAGSSNIELMVDGRAIQQALVNLIDNAIKHSPKGETVTTGIEQRNAAEDNAGVPPAVLLFVADHGPGIPPEEHKKIFERFYRRGSELRRETQGVGIGLSVVQHIVEAHNGRVRVQSMPGQGSRFIIELPLKY